jgi:hypothetical protein
LLPVSPLAFSNLKKHGHDDASSNKGTIDDGNDNEDNSGIHNSENLDPANSENYLSKLGANIPQAQLQAPTAQAESDFL